jgi:hypothetical protein
MGYYQLIKELYACGNEHYVSLGKAEYSERQIYSECTVTDKILLFHGNSVGLSHVPIPHTQFQADTPASSQIVACVKLDSLQNFLNCL